MSREPMTSAAKIDAKAVFDQASRFHFASVVLRVEFDELTAPTLEPYVVVSSFSSELYMKCIYAMETGGSCIRGHDLKKLFEVLALETREELGKNWTTVVQTYNHAYQQSGEEFRLPIDLVGQLDVSGCMFEDMRYFYEGGDFAKHWFLSPLPDLLRSLILVRRPAWAEGAALIAGSDGSQPVGPRWPFIVYGIPRPVVDSEDT